MSISNQTLIKRLNKIRNIMESSILYFDNLNYKTEYHDADKHDVIGLVQLYMYGFTPKFNLNWKDSTFSNGEVHLDNPYSELLVWLGREASNFLGIRSYEDLCKVTYTSPETIRVTEQFDYFSIDYEYTTLFDYLMNFLTNTKFNFYYRNILVVHTISEVLKDYDLSELNIPDKWIEVGMQSLEDNSIHLGETLEVKKDLYSSCVDWLGLNPFTVDQFEEF